MKEVRDGNIAGTIPDELSATGWIMRGAIREDDNPAEISGPSADEPGGLFHREFGHFFDPQNDRGLTVGGVTLGPTAPSWATDKASPVPLAFFVTRRGFNHFGASQAREAQWRALTLKRIAPDGGLTPEPSLSGTIDGADVMVDGEQLRKAYWATMFRAVGDMVHLVQDMAQPQHTRNDPHSGYGCAFGSCAAGHDSFYEKYLAARTIGQDFFLIKEGPLGGSGQGVQHSTITRGLDFVPPYQVAFNSYVDFLSTGTGAANDASAKGLANYSNRGFYSAGTNIGSTTFPSPTPSGLGLGNSSVGGVGDPVAKSITGDTLNDVKIEFRTGSVNDAIGGPSPSDVKLTTTGFWDEFLTQQGEGPRFSLNYYNYDDQAKLLIPRAAAYSAGLIDYFFRGQLQILPPTEGVYGILDHSVAGSNCKDTCGFSKIKLKVANATPDISPSGGGTVAPQIMSGGTLVVVAKYHRNTCYTTDLEGEYDTNKLINGATETKTDYMTRCRTSAEEITVSQPKANQTVPACNGDCNANAIGVTFNFDTPIPINATDLYLQVVYRGVLGSEQDAVVVGTKDLPEPTYLSAVNVTDYAVCYNNNIYYKSASGGLPYTSPASTPPQVPAMVEGVPAEAYYNPTSYGYWRLTFTAAPSLQIPAPGINEDLAIARVDAIQPQEFARVAVLIDDGRIYKEDIALHLDQVDKPLLNSALHQIDYAADGSPIARLLDYKDARFRKVKSNVPTFGIRYNVQGTGSCMQPTSISAEPTDPAYLKPSVMKTVTIKFPD